MIYLPIYWGWYSYFLSTKVLLFCFLLAVVVSASENTCIEMFFNKFESNIEKFEVNGLFYIYFCTSCTLHVASENSCIEMFFNKFESNIENFEANGQEFFNITWEFIERHRNTSVFTCGNNNSEEKTKR